MIQYKLIVKEDAHKVEQEVNRLLQEGYELQGGPVAINGAVAQAVTLEVEEEKNVGAQEGVSKSKK